MPAKSKSRRKTHQADKPKPDPTAKWSERKRRLLEELPNHAWDYVKAGIAAGYSRGYAETSLKTIALSDHSFSEAVLRKRQDLAAGSVSLRDEVERFLASAMRNSAVPWRDRIKACDGLARMNGWDVQTIRLETPERARQLTEIEAAEARRLALVMLSTHALPSAHCSDIVPNSSGGQGDSVTIDAQFVPIEGTETPDKGGTKAEQSATGPSPDGDQGGTSSMGHDDSMVRSDGQSGTKGGPKPTDSDDGSRVSTAAGAAQAPADGGASPPSGPAADRSPLYPVVSAQNFLGPGGKGE